MHDTATAKASWAQTSKCRRSKARAPYAKSRDWNNKGSTPLPFLLLLLDYYCYCFCICFLAYSFYLYEVVFYNISISVALYSLVVFYLASEPYLAPFRPLLKFVMVKSIIFVTWWQGLILNLLAKVRTVFFFLFWVFSLFLSDHYCYYVHLFIYISLSKFAGWHRG